MSNLLEIQREADSLSEKDRAGLAAHLLATISAPKIDISDVELEARDRDMDSGRVTPLSHEEFLKQVGRG